MERVNSQAHIVHLDDGNSFLGVCATFLTIAAFFLAEVGAPPIVFGAVFFAGVCLVVCLSWPLGSLFVLLTASVMPRFTVEIGGWKARPEHFAVLLVLLALVFRQLMGANESPVFTWADRFVVAYVVWCYIASAWPSPAPGLTLRWALLNNLAVLPYFLIRLLVRNERALRWTFNAFLATGIGECAYAVACFASRHLFGTSFGVEVGQYSAGFEGTYGTQAEPNILGSYSACLAIILLVVYFSDGRKRGWVVWGFTISLAAIFVALSRGAFISFVFGSAVLFSLGLKRRSFRIRKLLPIALGLAVVTAPIALISGRNLEARFAGLFQGGAESDTETIGRLVAWGASFEDIARHPIVGNGIASFQLLADVGQLPILGDRPWVGNSIVRIVHDTGLVGLLLFLGIIVSVSRDLKSALAGQGPRKRLIAAMAAGCLVYVVAFLSTEATILAFFWVHIGLLASACSLRFERHLIGGGSIEDVKYV